MLLMKRPELHDSARVRSLEGSHPETERGLEVTRAWGTGRCQFGVMKKFWPHDVNVLSAVNGTLKHG